MYSQLDEAARNNRVNHINRRWSQLYELEKEWGERALRFLLLTNSGGAIATLSFLGTSETAFGMVTVKIALILFIVGIVLVGLSNAKQFHHMSSMFSAWKVGVSNYFDDKISWALLHAEDDKLAQPDFWDYLFPYASFGCFVSGCVFGGIALFGQ